MSYFSNGKLEASLSYGRSATEVIFNTMAKVVCTTE